MSDHHDQAVTMALSVYNRTTDPTIRSFAQDVLVFQRAELGRMAAYLEDHDAVRPDYDPERPSHGLDGHVHAGGPHDRDGQRRPARRAQPRPPAATST